MRYFLGLVLFCAVGLSASEALANGALVVKAADTSRGYAVAPPPSKPGLFHRLCGKHETAVAAPSAYRDASTGTATYIVADPARPCENGPGIVPPGYVAEPTTFRGSLAGPYGHCFPNCFTGTPCSCCRHHIRYVHAWSHEGKQIAATIQQNPSASGAVKVEEPGWAAPFFRKKQFTHKY